MSKLFTVFVSFILFPLFGYSLNAPASAAACVACHGQKGISASPLWPNLAGQKQDYLEKQLHDFKSNKRQDPMMNPVVQALTEEDIKEVSHYFSNLNSNQK